MCSLKPVKIAFFDWTALRKFLIFNCSIFPRQQDHVSGASFMSSFVVNFDHILPFNSTHSGFFLLISIEMCHSNFFWKIKRDHKLSKTFHLIKLKVDYWMIFCLVLYFAAKTGHLWLKQSCLVAIWNCYISYKNKFAELLVIQLLPLLNT